MARKKHRDIKVDGTRYGWITRHNGRTIEIWKDKKPIFEMKNNEVHPVTPAYIKEIIKQNVL